MSQHYMTTGKYAVLVGWDRPLQYFFGAVWNVSEEGLRRDVLFSTLHLADGGARSVAGLADVLRPYAELPGAIREALAEDQLQNRGNAVRTWEFDNT